MALDKQDTSNMLLGALVLAESEKLGRDRPVGSCPYCGGGLPKRKAKICMHCRNKVFWARACGLDFVGRTEEEAEAFSQAHRKEEERREIAAKAFAQKEAQKRAKIRKEVSESGGFGFLIFGLGVWFLAAPFFFFIGFEGIGYVLASLGPLLVFISVFIIFRVYFRN